MHVPATSSPGAHDHHDQALIAAQAAGDLTPIQAASAEVLLSSCTACSDLHRDLIAIAAAARALPRELPAPRDYRLTSEHAAALRRGSWVRRLLRPFASARSAAQPLAAAFSTLGVAGLLVAAFAPTLLGAAASAPTRDGATGAGAQAFSAAPNAPEAAGANASGDAIVKVDATSSGFDVAVGGDTGGSGQVTTDTTDDGRLSGGAAPPNLLVMGSLGLLAAGITLFGLRFAARRLR